MGALALAGIGVISLAPREKTAVPIRAYMASARPSELGDRCYEETMSTTGCLTGQSCLDSGRTPYWDARGAYEVIKMAAIHSRFCTNLCCPEKPPVGTCYKKWMTFSCATD